MSAKLVVVFGGGRVNPTREVSEHEAAPTATIKTGLQSGFAQLRECDQPVPITRAELCTRKAYREFISGASRVGARNIFKANFLLSTDKDISQAFQQSNLTGSFRAERDAQAVAAGAQKKFEIPDIPSDKINADRVSLAAMLDYFDRNPQKVAAVGYKNSTLFAKDLLSGKLADPTITADAWSHVAAVGSRTLGIDPFRINTDLVSRSALSPAFGVFVKQPARIARLAAHNIEQGSRRTVHNADDDGSSRRTCSNPHRSKKASGVLSIPTARSKLRKLSIKSTSSGI